MGNVESSNASTHDSGNRRREDTSYTTRSPGALQSTGSRAKEIDLSHKDLDNVDCLSGLTGDHVESLIIRSNRLTALSPVVLNLKHLTQLSLKGNRFTTFPLEICQLTRLRWLSLAENQLRDIPCDIGNLQDLELLSVATNRLTSLPETITRCTKLVGLDIQRNALSSLPEQLGQCTKLEILLVQRNRLSGLPSSLESCVSLKKLNFAYNELSVIPEFITKLYALSELICSNNGIRTLPQDMFDSMAALEVFDMHTNLVSAIPYGIRNCISLRRLNLAINKLTAFPEAATELTSLVWLNLNDNKITEIPKSISQLQSLVKLGIVQNQLQTLPYELACLKSLEKIDARRNHITYLPSVAFFMKHVVFILGDNPLKTSNQVLAGNPLSVPSLTELCARMAFRDHFETMPRGTSSPTSSTSTSNESISTESSSHRRSYSVMNIAKIVKEKLTSNTTKKTSDEMIKKTATLDHTETYRGLEILPFSVQRYFQTHKTCHVCLSPMFDGCIEFVQLKQVTDSKFRSVDRQVPFYFELCSTKCYRKCIFQELLFAAHCDGDYDKVMPYLDDNSSKKTKDLKNLYIKESAKVGYKFYDVVSKHQSTFLVSSNHPLIAGETSRNDGTNSLNQKISIWHRNRSNIASRNHNNFETFDEHGIERF